MKIIINFIKKLLKLNSISDKNGKIDFEKSVKKASRKRNSLVSTIKRLHRRQK